MKQTVIANFMIGIVIQTIHLIRENMVLVVINTTPFLEKIKKEIFILIVLSVNIVKINKRLLNQSFVRCKNH